MFKTTWQHYNVDCTIETMYKVELAVICRDVMAFAFVLMSFLTDRSRGKIILFPVPMKLPQRILVKHTNPLRVVNVSNIKRKKTRIKHKRHFLGYEIWLYQKSNCTKNSLITWYEHLLLNYVILFHRSSTILRPSHCIEINWPRLWLFLIYLFQFE